MHMKVIKKNNYNNVFPMKIVCHQVVDKYGFAYGKENDFCGSELEIEATDIKMHKWYKYPDYNGVDFGVICPVCGKFIPIDTCKIPARILDGTEEIPFHEEEMYGRQNLLLRRLYALQI